MVNYDNFPLEDVAYIQLCDKHKGTPIMGCPLCKIEELKAKIIRIKKEKKK